MEVKMAFNDAMPTPFDVIIPFCGRKLFLPLRFYCHIVNVLSVLTADHNESNKSPYCQVRCRLAASHLYNWNWLQFPRVKWSWKAQRGPTHMFGVFISVFEPI